MKNKKNKFSSLKSVLILLQQLQVRYYGNDVFDIMLYSTGTIKVYVCLYMYEPKSFIFCSYDGPVEWLEEYRKLLMHLNADKL